LSLTQSHTPVSTSMHTARHFHTLRGTVGVCFGNKMVLLYWTYVYVIYQEYGRNLSTLGVDAKEIPAYQSLWQCVAPLDRQNVINL